MRHVRLGRTGLPVSRLCLGTMTFGLQPVAGGFLSGKHRREAGPTPGTRFTLGTAAGRYQDRYWHEREFDTVEALRPLAAEAGMSLTRLALAWVLAQPGINATIVGASRPDQLD
jgi:aryl-alcohol dehydrogenase-like predicted oxidoreductase